jgi:hypothetical protein
MAQELEDTFQPTHELIEEAVVVKVDFVDELVKVVLVTRTEINERLDGLVGICRDFLPLTGFDSLDGVVDEHGEIGDAVVDVRRLIHTNERLIEDGEEVPEELKSSRLCLLANAIL